MNDKDPSLATILELIFGQVHAHDVGVFPRCGQAGQVQGPGQQPGRG